MKAITFINQVRFSITPNPASEQLQILDLTAELQAEITQISIYDLNGKIAFFHPGFIQTIDVSNLTAGNYFVQISLPESQVTKKIIVQ